MRKTHPSNPHQVDLLGMVIIMAIIEAWYERHFHLYTH
jgi:hypothetical protein